MTDDPAGATQQAYDATAKRYRERWYHRDPLVDAKKMLASVLPVGGHVLDVGCGPGRDIEWFQQHGFAVIGLDRSHAMLDTVTTAAPLICADVRRIPLPEASIDGWWASASLLHLPAADLTIALRDLHRVTTPRGVGFLSVKQGFGERFELVYGGPHRRFFCYWQPPALDRALRQSHWSVDSAWVSADSLGRQPWLCRLVRRA